MSKTTFFYISKYEKLVWRKVETKLVSSFFGITVSSLDAGLWFMTRETYTISTCQLRIERVIVVVLQSRRMQSSAVWEAANVACLEAFVNCRKFGSAVRVEVRLFTNQKIRWKHEFHRVRRFWWKKLWRRCIEWTSAWRYYEKSCRCQTDVTVAFQHQSSKLNEKPTENKDHCLHFIFSFILWLLTHCSLIVTHTMLFFSLFNTVLFFFFAGFEPLFLHDLAFATFLAHQPWLEDYRNAVSF